MTAEPASPSTTATRGAATRRQAVMAADGSIALESAPTGPLAPDRVRVAIAYAGICGSDLHQDPSAWRGPMGHEQSGTVVEVGSDVREVSLGDRVVVTSAGGGLGFESGGWSDSMDVRPFQLVPVPPSAGLDAAALAEPLTCAVHGLDRAGFRPGATVLVLGAGPLGLLLIHLLRICGAGAVLVSEPDETRRRRAAEAGADVVDPRATDLPEWVAERTAGSGAPIVIEVTGNPVALEEGVRAAAHSGTVVVLGVAAEGVLARIPARRMFTHELTIRGAAGWGTAFPRAMALLDRIPVDQVVTDIVPLDDLDHALRRARVGDSGKVLLRPGAAFAG